MSTILEGTVTKGYGVAGRNLQPLLPLIEERSGLSPLIPETLNLRLPREYTVTPAFVVSRSEYKRDEELRFCPCTIDGIPSLIMRPDTHEAGGGHGRAYLEVMSTVWLRETLGLADGSVVTVLID